MSDLSFCCKEILVLHIEHLIVTLNDPWLLADRVTDNEYCEFS